MGYLVCNKCEGYYKLQDGESPDDFDRCQCGIQQKEHEEDNIKYNENRDKFFRENFITNSGFIALTFSIIPLYFGFMYSNWILYLITGFLISMSMAFIFLNNSNNNIKIMNFQRMFVFTGIIFGLTTLILLSLFGNSEFLQDLMPHYYSRGGYIIVYISSLYFSGYFCYIFLKNSRMGEKIDVLNSIDLNDLRFNYYYIIFALYLAIFLGMVIAVYIRMTA